MRCLKCETIMGWQNDFNLTDVGINDEGVCSYYYCGECDSLHRFDTYNDGTLVMICLKGDEKDA